MLTAVELTIQRESDCVQRLELKCPLRGSNGPNWPGEVESLQCSSQIPKAVNQTGDCELVEFTRNTCMLKDFGTIYQII